MAQRAISSDLPDEHRRRVIAAAQTRAAEILTPELHAAADLTPDLEGLGKGRATLSRIYTYRDNMDRLFGSIDPTGIMQPLHLRMDELQGDPAIFAALRDRLDEASRDSAGAVRDTAARYVDIAPGQIPPEIATIVADAEALAEVRAVVVTDLSANSDKHEPTVEEIAGFALQRLREANAKIAATETAGMTGDVQDPVQAILCLQQPALWTGQTGFGARLLAVEKLGCIAGIPKTRYVCNFTQNVVINLPGGDAFDGGTLSAMAQELSKEEALDARFMRAADGGWNVIWGDLD